MAADLRGELLELDLNPVIESADTGPIAVDFRFLASRIVPLEALERTNM